MNQLKQLHAFSLRTGADHTQTLILKLLQIPNLTYAHNLFDEIPQPNLFLYNKLIHAYSLHGPHHQCFSLYSCLLHRKTLAPNHLTFTFLFPACASLSSRCLATMIHAHFIISCCETDVFVGTGIIDMYAKLGMLDSARKQFDRMEIRDVPTWNALITGYTRCGDMKGAWELFNGMPSRNVVSWTAMVAGYSQNGQYVDALRVFLKMEKETDVAPNEVTVASILPACANLGALEIGERLETYARRNGYVDNMFVCNALLEMYAKCGRLDVARRLFDGLGKRRNLCSWNSMIMGLAIHGRYDAALGLFHEMLREGKMPDDVTFVGVLMACTHGGLVSKGKELFGSMARDFNISPKLEHYGCMVDLLGRAGKLEEAYKLIQNMHMKTDSVIWGTLLGACSFHKNLEVAEKAAEQLFELEPWNPGNYVILSNIYASAKRWDGVAKMRRRLKGCQLVKAAGHSFIEEGSQIHKFIVDDKSHPRSDEIYALLVDLFAKMRNVKDKTAFVDMILC